MSCLLISAVMSAACTSPAPDAESLALELPGGEELPIERYPAQGDELVLWVPSGFGVRPQHAQYGRELAQQGIEVWLADMHTAYFEPRGPHSVDVFVPGDIAWLVDQAIARGKQRIYLFSTSGGARPVLKAVRDWQLSHPGAGNLRGVLLFHPVLYAHSPGLNEEASYLQVVAETNVPVFIVQPELSTTSARVASLVERLGQGGARVMIQRLPGVKDGYHLRPDDSLTSADRQARSQLSQLMLQALKKLDLAGAPKQAASAVSPEQQPSPPPHAAGLVAYTGSAATPALHLQDLDGGTRDLAEFRDTVVMVSFWASWCAPCVKEMPSQDRLEQSLRGRPFRILAVNVGEDSAAIYQFLREHPVGFTILRDPDQRAYRDWKVYVVPTNFILDRNGRIRYGSVGAVDWEDAEVKRAVTGLLDETGPGNAGG